VVRLLDAAVEAGLDFLAVTDHNTASHWLELDRLQLAYDRLLLLHGREITTYRGHAIALGERRFTDFRPGSYGSLGRLLDELHAEGAFVSINHPAAPDDERCMGCGWDRGDGTANARVDGVEVVNGDQRSGPFFGWPVWAELRNRGYRVTAVGGSDFHEAGGPRRLGTPATVVFAQELSEEALLEGLRRGRAYVRTQGPAGPVLDFGATAGGRHYAMGDVIIAAGDVPVELSARIRGAAGQELVWIRRGVEAELAHITSQDQTMSRLERARDGDWFSLILRDAGGPTLLSNSIDVAAP
jgi:predicted metal-dependent phosphoesterase TrpH